MSTWRTSQRTRQQKFFRRQAPSGDAGHVVQLAFQVDVYLLVVHAAILRLVSFAVILAIYIKLRMRVAVCQLHSRAGDVDGNIATVEALLAEAAAESADLVVVPETFLHGYHIGAERLRALALEAPTTGELPEASALGRLSQIVRKHGVALLVGFAEAEGGGDVVYNSVALFDTDGSLVSRYRKCHLWGAYERCAFASGPGSSFKSTSAAASSASHEAASMTLAAGTAAPTAGAPRGLPAPSNAFQPVTLARFPDLPLGLLICFDMEFPETARLLAIGGARIIIAVMASGEPDAFTARLMVPVRAAENSCSVVFCNFPSSAPPDQRAGPSTAASDVTTATASNPAATVGGPISVAYSGGSAVAMPDGKFAAALPSFVCSASLDRPVQPQRSGCSDVRVECPGLDAGATERMQHALERRGILSTSCDERILVVDINPLANRYAAARQRNPYLVERRPGIYKGLEVA